MTWKFSVMKEFHALPNPIIYFSKINLNSILSNQRDGSSRARALPFFHQLPDPPPTVHASSPSWWLAVPTAENSKVSTHTVHDSKPYWWLAVPTAAHNMYSTHTVHASNPCWWLAVLQLHTVRSSHTEHASSSCWWLAVPTAAHSTLAICFFQI